MKCKIWDCQNQAPYPYHGCNMNHGIQYKREIKDYLEYASGTPLSNWYSYNSPANWSVEKWIYMAQKSLTY